MKLALAFELTRELGYVYGCDRDKVSLHGCCYFEDVLLKAMDFELLVQDCSASEF